jgi:2-dehydropantoate 2-reductase
MSGLLFLLPTGTSYQPMPLEALTNRPRLSTTSRVNHYRPRIAVIGAGAIGGYYGARLAQHGYDVHFLVRSDYDALSANGWIIKSIDGDFVVPANQVQVYNDAAAMPKADLVIVATKSTSNDAIPALLRPLLHEKTVILTLQNGLGVEEDLAALFGQDRIVGGMAFVCINRLEPGVIHHMSHGMIRVGPLTEARREITRQIVAMFQASKIRCEELTSLAYGRWLKLVWNIPFNGWGTVMDADTEKLLANATGRELVAECMAEVIAAARSQGVNLPDSTIDEQIDRTYPMGPYKSSMQIDRQVGRPLEIEAIIERPLKVARSAGLKCPNWEMLLRLLRVLQA